MNLLIMIKKNYTQTELKLPTNEEVVPKKSDIENSNQSKKLSPKRPLKKRSNTRITISQTNKVPESKKKLRH